MKRFTIALAMVLLLALGALATACDDGGEELTLEQYFQRFEAVNADFNGQFNALLTQLPQAFEDPAQTRDYFDAASVLLRANLDQLDRIDPPAEVEDPHNEYLDVGEGIADATEDFAAQLADVESAQELQEALEQPLEAQFDAVGRRFDAACLALEGFAADNGILVDLDCE